LDDRPKGQRITRGDEMDRRPKKSHADGLPIGDELGEVIRFEAIEAAPERHVGIRWNLRLQADEPLDRVRCRHPRAPEEQLPRE
jgi:hypothetical protein